MGMSGADLIFVAWLGKTWVVNQACYVGVPTTNSKSSPQPDLLWPMLQCSLPPHLYM